MKLSKFDTVTKSNAGADIPLLDLRTKQPTDVVFTILGTDSDVFKDLQSERGRKLMEEVQARGKGYAPTREDMDRSTCELLAKCTVGWSGLAEDDGTPIPFSQDRAIDIYMRYPRIRDQINTAMADPANFLMG